MKGGDAVSTLEPPRAMLDRLTARHPEIAGARPLPEPTLRSLLDNFTIRYAHHTAATLMRRCLFIFRVGEKPHDQQRCARQWIQMACALLDCLRGVARHERLV